MLLWFWGVLEWFVFWGGMGGNFGWFWVLQGCCRGALVIFGCMRAVFESCVTVFGFIQGVVCGVSGLF